MQDRTKSNQELASVFVQLPEHQDRLLFDMETKSYWWYEGNIWKPYPPDEMRRNVSALIWHKDPGNRMTIGKQMDIVNQVKDYLGKGVNGRSYGFKVESVEEKGISFSDGVLLFDDMRLVEPSSCMDRFSTVYLNFNYSELESCPSPFFDKYMKDTCTAKDGTFNSGMMMQLQEVAGYVLGNEKAEKAIILYGLGANGKSPFLDLLEAMIGRDRTASLSMEELTSDRFALADLLGKKANILDEDESEKIRMGKLKALISGRPQRAQRKFEQGFRCRSNVKMVFSTNEPVIIDVSLNANRRRLMIIPFEHTIEEKDYDRRLSEKMIRSELPAVVRWALAGFVRLRENNCVFTSTPQSMEAMKEVEMASSSVVDYLRQEWKEDLAYTVPVSEVYASYLSHCRNYDNRKPVSSNKFFRSAQTVLGDSFPTTLSGISARCFRARRIDGKKVNSPQLSLGSYEADCVRKPEDATVEF